MTDRDDSDFRSDQFAQQGEPSAPGERERPTSPAEQQDSVASPAQEPGGRPSEGTSAARSFDMPPNARPSEGPPNARPSDPPPIARPQGGPQPPPRSAPPQHPAAPPWDRMHAPPPPGYPGYPGYGKAGQGHPGAERSAGVDRHPGAEREAGGEREPGGEPQPGADRPPVGEWPPAGDRPPGAERGPHPGAHRADPPTEWVNPPRAERPEPPEWPAERDATQPVGPRWSDPASQPLPARWGPPPAPGGAPTTNWSYVDQIRSSELVRTRKVPPARGWRKAVFTATFGLINLGQSPDERRQAELEAKVRSLLRGHYKIGVLGKGGVGKTTVAASVGSIFAALRADDRVVAIDADTAFGKLGSRIDPNAAGSYWELATDEYLHSFADVRARVGSNACGLFVLAGEASTARRRVLEPAVYREAASRLDNHFTISIVDCGSTLDSPVTQEALRDLDALIVVSSPWVDGASAAGQTMEWLANRGMTGLLHRTVVVLNDSDGHADNRTRSVLRDQFGSRGQVVIEVPYDPHLRPGGVIDIDNEVNRVTRRRFLEIAASIAEHFAATTDRPRERR